MATADALGGCNEGTQWAHAENCSTLPLRAHSLGGALVAFTADGSGLLTAGKRDGALALWHIRQSADLGQAPSLLTHNLHFGTAWHSVA